MKQITTLIAALGLAAAAHSATIVFSNGFNQDVPPEVEPGTAAIEPVQGFAGLGLRRYKFGKQFLRSAGNNVVTLTLSDLPPHQHICLGFLFAAIDSLDGSGTFPADDNFKVTLDGSTVFRESFANALDTQIQSYVPPPHVELARKQSLGFGFGSIYADSAYNMAADPIFQRIPHTASTAVFTFVLEGTGVQTIDDESWAMDNLVVTVSP